MSKKIILSVIILNIQYFLYPVYGMKEDDYYKDEAKLAHKCHEKKTKEIKEIKTSFWSWDNCVDSSRSIFGYDVPSKIIKQLDVINNLPRYLDEIPHESGYDPNCNWEKQKESILTFENVKTFCRACKLAEKYLTSPKRKIEEQPSYSSYGEQTSKKQKKKNNTNSQEHFYEKPPSYNPDYFPSAPTESNNQQKKEECLIFLSHYDRVEEEKISLPILKNEREN